MDANNIFSNNKLTFLCARMPGQIVKFDSLLIYIYTKKAICIKLSRNDKQNVLHF